MSLFGVQLDISAKEIIYDMKLKFSKLYGGFEVREFFIFSKMITNNQDCLNIDQLEIVLKNINIFLSISKLQVLMLKFKEDNYENCLNIQKMYDSFKDPLNNRRSNLILKFFKTIDTENNGYININDLLRNYDFFKHDLIKFNKIKLEDFVSRFKNLFISEEINFEDFKNVFSDISSTISSDEMFSNMFKELFNINEDETKTNLNEKVNESISNVRKYLITHNNKLDDEFHLKKLALKHNLNTNGLINEIELDKLFNELKNPTSTEILKEIMNKFEKNSNGDIYFQDLERFLLYNPYN